MKLFQMLIVACLLTSFGLFAKPHFNQSLIQKDPSSPFQTLAVAKRWPLNTPLGPKVMRVQIDHKKEDESFHLAHLDIENSGTPALWERVRKKDPLGSYRAEIYRLDSGQVLFHSAVGTGTYYRLLTRAMSFRFPFIQGEFGFRMFAEHPISGKMEKVLETKLSSE